MKALQISRYGIPSEVVEVVDVAEPDAPRANEVLAAVEYDSMSSISPPTARLLLGEYVDLEPGDWVIQNAGN
jgi:hypothetical protein